MTAGVSIYLSGWCLSAEDRLLTFLEEILSQNQENVTLIGSSGGSLFAAYFALGLSDDISKYEFVAVCNSFQKFTLTWDEKYNILRDWIKSLTGGAMCTVRQWRARSIRNFAIMVYDQEKHSPLLISHLDNFHLADVLLSACFRESPSFTYADTFKYPWIDIENIINSTVICSSLKPSPLLNFTCKSSFELKRPWNTCLDSQIVLDLYDAMLVQLPTTLTMTFQQASLPESGLAVFDPYRWCRGLMHNQTKPHVDCSLKHDYVQCFSASFLTWYLVACFIEF